MNGNKKEIHAIDSKLSGKCNTIQNISLLSDDELYDLIKRKNKNIKLFRKNKSR